MEECEIQNSKDLFNHGTYMGETSRVLRTRINEHIKALEDLNKDSFIVEHWQEVHGQEMVPPVFKFTALSTHRDCLSRQLREAIFIKEKGRLNRKKEYSNNELIKMEVQSYSWEQERIAAAEGQEKRRVKENVEMFINCVKNVKKLSEENIKKSKESNCCRYKRPSAVNIDTWQVKRVRMATSTPVQWRKDVSLLELSEPSMEETDSSNSSLGLDQKPYLSLIDTAKRITPQMDDLRVTPRIIESNLLKLVKQTIAASEYFDSAEFRRKTISKRTRTTSFIQRCEMMEVDNVLSNVNKSVSMDSLLHSIDWEEWENDKEWRKSGNISSSKKVLNDTKDTDEVEEKNEEECYE